MTMNSGFSGAAGYRVGSDLVANIYSLPTDETVWTRLCDSLAAELNAVGVVIRPGRPDPSSPHSPALSEVHKAYIRDGWQKVSFRERGLPLLPRKGIFVDQDFITESEMEAEPYYQEFLAPHGLKWGAGIGFRIDDHWWLAKVLRSPQQGPFDEDVQPKLSEIGRHLGRACEMSLMLRRKRVQGLVEGLFALNLGAFAIDCTGKVAVMNRIAEGLLGKEIDVSRGYLTASDPTIQEALEKLIATLRSVDAAPPLENIIIPQPSGQYPLVLQACRVDGARESVLPSIRGILVVTNPNRRTASGRDLMAETFGLSRSEAAIVAQLIKGHSIEESANNMQLSRETVRSHLKSIFQKTSTHRQSELVMLANRLASLPERF